MYMTFTVVLHYTEHLSGTAIYFPIIFPNEFFLYLNCKCLSLFIFYFWNLENSLLCLPGNSLFLMEINLSQNKEKKSEPLNSCKLVFSSKGFNWCHDRKTVITRAQKLQPKTKGSFSARCCLANGCFCCSLLLLQYPCISSVWSKV